MPNSLTCIRCGEYDASGFLGEGELCSRCRIPPRVSLDTAGPVQAWGRRVECLVCAGTGCIPVGESYGRACPACDGEGEFFEPEGWW